MKESMKESSVSCDRIVLPDPDSLELEKSFLSFSSKNPDNGLNANNANKAMQSVIRDLSIIPFLCFRCSSPF